MRRIRRDLADRRVERGQIRRQATFAPLRQRVIGSRACERVIEKALGYTSRATEYLEQLPPSPARTLLRSVAEQLAARSR